MDAIDCLNVALLLAVAGVLTVYILILIREAIQNRFPRLPEIPIKIKELPRGKIRVRRVRKGSGQHAPR